MKAGLLKKFRKRFVIVPDKDGGLALLDLKKERILTTNPYGGPLVTTSQAIERGAWEIMGAFSVTDYLRDRARARELREFKTRIAQINKFV